MSGVDDWPERKYYAVRSLLDTKNEVWYDV